MCLKFFLVLNLVIHSLVVQNSEKARITIVCSIFEAKNMDSHNVFISNSMNRTVFISFFYSCDCIFQNVRVSFIQ